MNLFRWWLFKSWSKVGWAICPEPQRSDLKSRLTLDLSDPDRAFLEHIDRNGWLDYFKEGT